MFQYTTWGRDKFWIFQILFLTPFCNQKRYFCFCSIVTCASDESQSALYSESRSFLVGAHQYAPSKIIFVNVRAKQNQPSHFSKSDFNIKFNHILQSFSGKSRCCEGKIHRLTGLLGDFCVQHVKSVFASHLNVKG